MKIIVGLGNPGPKYAQTRHNIGFLTVDRLAEKLGISINQEKWRSLVGETSVSGEKVLLLKPLTYMNRSGEAVIEVVRFFQCPVEDVLVIYDDLDLPFGTMRLRLKGGHGGHNGVRSLIDHLGSQTFKRIRMGIGRPENGDVVHYVLNPFHPQERQQLAEFIDRGASAAEAYLDTDDFTQVMNRYNQKLRSS
ncbi:Peptidyl-tRNA hydrolase [Caldalkalibacillus thermarum TA2.A1]|uniref:Peptidyl-tRNA hydrolase n=1 Tax=Caldalkalibacillus thermarum (strain TA2.A1) TaxID=986075 RepID=F5L9Z2_CALTT|nr:aminoacyl-tRNA hydrolase [Caldalkalibacillus thermarum]EGL81862.1 Peptidyl-tRNA hydrolase [Caldalkalibacillus thermarum TA2.A1]QZT34349.1 aminoacyl-tRNA hydrolase [Caldalkalibacillus thermarum TA2.A1]